jgi:hypothetical protein
VIVDLQMAIYDVLDVAWASLGPIFVYTAFLVGPIQENWRKGFRHQFCGWFDWIYIYIYVYIYIDIIVYV